ncbi:RNA-directed DNA polymerase, eukaryota, reverse transcriptase zinc-binding domain protein [Tanacetum coccineum]
MNMEMSEFKDVVNTLEIEDLCSSGFNFTWTKSLKNPLTTTLKKLDRIMINEEVTQSYKKAHGIFLPYLISDHSPSVLIKGCNMYKVVQKLKTLKKPLRNLNWKNGNVFEKMQNLKQSLYDIQRQLDGDSFNKDLKECSIHIELENTKAELNPFVRKMVVDLKVRRMVTNEEIKAALFDIDSSKAACPDGYNSCFFKKAWSCIGEEVSLVVKDFFLNGKMLGEINATLIASVPKLDTPNKVYESQAYAFTWHAYLKIKLLISQELLKGYNRKNGAKRCAMKIEIQKAYDTVSWDFFRHALILVGFHEVMISWIMTCITAASFSICINGENIAATPSFRYHYGCKELKLTHMCFTDDLMVLCNGDKASLEVVKKAIEEFSCVPGLFPNLSKSIIFFGSINEDRKKELLEVLPFKHGKLPMKYLGVPLISKKLSLSDCKSVIDNVDTRINNWRNKLLSYAGRIQLIASVLSAMHQYWASVYMLPVGVIKEMDKIFKRFLWNSSNSAQGKARVSWKIVCRPKNQGGLGIKPLHKGKLWGRLKVVAHVNKSGDGSSYWIVPLANSIPKKARNDARMKDNDIVADLVHNGAWLWPSEWVSLYLVLSQIDVPVFNQNKDIVWWIDDCNKKVKYSVNTAWLSLRDKRPNVNWRHVVWNKRIFKNEIKSIDELMIVIKKHVTDMLMSLKVKSYGAHWLLAKGIHASTAICLFSRSKLANHYIVHVEWNKEWWKMTLLGPFYALPKEDRQDMSEEGGNVDIMIWYWLIKVNLISSALVLICAMFWVSAEMFLILSEFKGCRDIVLCYLRYGYCFV